MAELPYKFTICPDQEPPKLTTATCPSMLKLLVLTPDLTINQNARDIWAGKNPDVGIETKLAQLLPIESGGKE